MSLDKGEEAGYQLSSIPHIVQIPLFHNNLFAILLRVKVSSPSDCDHNPYPKKTLFDKKNYFAKIGKENEKKKQNMGGPLFWERNFTF